MKPKFHIQCTTPEDLRAELLQWLSMHAATAQDLAEHLARTKKEQLVAFTKAQIYREIATFWQEIIIDKRDEHQPP